MANRADLRIAVAVNPCAGNGRVARQWPLIEAAIRKEVGTFAVLESLRPGHIQALVRTALLEGYDRIVAVGGDGTVHEAVNGFFDGLTPINPHASLAIIPLGTGSDFARMLGIPKGVAAVSLIASPHTIRSDIGRAALRLNEGCDAIRYFAVLADIGMGGVVVKIANESSKHLGAFATYLRSILSALATYRNCSLRLEIDGAVIEQRCRDVIISNSCYCGGGMRVAPDARLDSGAFEVFVIGDVSVPVTLLKLPKLYRGKLKGDPACRYFAARRIEARSMEGRAPSRSPLDEQVLVNLDGEQPGTLPVTIEIVPGALKVVSG